MDHTQQPPEAAHLEKVEEKPVEPEEEKKKEFITPAMTAAGVEAAEEAKLRSKYPSVGRPMAGHSAFLQKRLTKGQKYFDSGDYQMAKQKSASNKSRMPPLLAQPTGEAIPTPESVPVRKTSIIHSKLTSAS
ncbi:cAMP-regulated phosphoprotein 19 [Procambarus clarkii]|uniref:cAMP-regulated phosphoprotein 19 n=1 Tax=Procambarus clarkii TaxID=6728 RepID=UPI001E67399E|nr:cAMP-regulated phosphoprotein 19-like [Procambarus clarkii]